MPAIYKVIGGVPAFPLPPADMLKFVATCDAGDTPLSYDVVMDDIAVKKWEVHRTPTGFEMNAWSRAPAFINWYDDAHMDAWCMNTQQ
jgi:hypothetical protein